MKKKDICTIFAQGLLLRAGYEVYRPCFSSGCDLLIRDPADSAYRRILVLNVVDPKPIVSLKTTGADQKTKTRIFDALFCIHLGSLTCWNIPQEDVPDKESLYLSSRYDDYKVSLLRPADITVSENQEMQDFDQVRTEKHEIEDSLEELTSETEPTFDDILNLFGDD